ncbi:MAG: ABC transporter substrate-binding protein [Clostridia bacterium]|nr:ABC transporter substrate-binding protein [Clostridia bacterium]
MKKISALLMLICAALLLCACTGEKPAAEEAAPIVIGFSQLGSESSWRIGNTKDMTEAAERAGITMMLKDGRQKQENQIAAIREFIAHRVDVIVFSPIVEDGWDNVLREAKQAGIPVLLIDRIIQTTDDSLYAGCIGADFYLEGRNAGEYLLKKADAMGAKELHVVEITGTEDSTPMRQRMKGFHSVVDGDSRIVTLESVNGDFLRSRGRECMEYLLKKYDGEIDVVYSHNDSMTLGAIEALEAAGVKPGQDVIIITVDGEQAAIDLLKEGKINCVVECTPMLGDEVMRLCTKLAGGEKIVKLTHPVEQVFTDFDDLTQIGPRGY